MKRTCRYELWYQSQHCIRKSRPHVGKEHLCSRVRSTRVLVLQSDAHKTACAVLETRGWDVCWFCGVTTKGDAIKDSHEAGFKHRQRMDLTYCAICGVQATSHRDMIQHLRGMRHQVHLLVMTSR